MSGGYAVNVEDIVTIHCNTIREAAAHAWAHVLAGDSHS
jgi:hypothetical protein